jgi:hypothetical protein
MHWTNLLRLIIGTCAACFLATSSLPAQAPRTDLQPLDDAEAYRVYASLVPREWSVTAAHATRLVFQQETATNWQCMPSGKRIETDWREVMDNVGAANAAVKLLRDLLVWDADARTCSSSRTVCATGEPLSRRAFCDFTISPVEPGQ